MRVAITGSSGLIGSRLKQALIDRGDTPVPVVRRSAAEGEIHWDPDAGSIDTAAFEGIDAVVHLAGEGVAAKRWTDEQKQEILTSRTEGTALLAEALAALDAKPAVFVSGSAIGIYGDRGAETLTEDSARGTGFLSDVVVAWEAAAQPAVDAGIRTAFIRTGIVLTPDGGALAEQLPFFKLGIGGRIGDGKAWWPWISIDDEIRAILFLIDNEAVSGPVNLTAPNPVTNAEFASALGKALGRPTFIPTPTFAVSLRLGKELADSILASTRVLPTVLQEHGFEFVHPTIEPALEAIL